MGEILFLAHRVPWPPNRGDKIRSHHFLQKLMDCAPVHMACFAEDEAERQTGWVRKSELASREIVLRHKPQWQAGIEALFSGKPVSLTSFESLRAFERKIAKRADYSLLVSDAEAALFRERSGLSDDRVKAIGNGIDLEFYDPVQVQPVNLEDRGPLILFTGQMDYQPNVQAVDSFSLQVMPDCQRHPEQSAGSNGDGQAGGCIAMCSRGY